MQPPSTTKGHFAQDAFTIDNDKKTVTCPAGILVELRPPKDGANMAEFEAMMRRKHGGRRARGWLRVAHDFALLAAATNLARLAILSDAV